MQRWSVKPARRPLSLGLDQIKMSDIRIPALGHDSSKAWAFSRMHLGSASAWLSLVWGGRDHLNILHHVHVGRLLYGEVSFWLCDGLLHCHCRHYLNWRIPNCFPPLAGLCDRCSILMTLDWKYDMRQINCTFWALFAHAFIIHHVFAPSDASRGSSFFGCFWGCFFGS